MNKIDLFLKGCKSNRWKWRQWRISLFAVTQLPADYKPELYDINYTEDATLYYSETNEWLPVTDAPKDKALFNAIERADFPDDSIPSNPKAFESTYGRMLFNWMVMHYAFGAKLPYQNETTPSSIVKLFSHATVDEPEDGVYDDSKFYPSEISKFVKALFELTSLCPYVTPTGSIKTLTTHPDMAKTRAMLLERYKDQLDDPAVITMIQDELVELDKAWLEGDNSEGYYMSNKAFSVKRKKMFVMHGIESSFKDSGDFELITSSLAEGWDTKKLPAKYNAIREGSYDRGSDTALGGEKVTFLQRIFQNIQVIEGDCGTKNTHALVLSNDNYKTYVGMNHMVQGVPVELTDVDAPKYFNKVIQLRRPILCAKPSTDYCAVCATAALAKNPRAVAAEIAAVGSAIMSAFMASMHGVELAVSHYDYKQHIS